MLRSRSHAGSASNLKRELAAERAQRQRMAQLLTELARLLTTGAKLPPCGGSSGRVRELCERGSSVLFTAPRRWDQPLNESKSPIL